MSYREIYAGSCARIYRRNIPKEIVAFALGFLTVALAVAAPFAAALIAAALSAPR